LLVKLFRMRTCLLLILIYLSSCSNTYYVVRHGEKATPAPNGSTDVPLTPEGEQRAIALKDAMKDKKIKDVYATQYIRTQSTAKPTADYFSLPLHLYGPAPDSNFIQTLKAKRHNVLIVGHSNTIDDVVNKLCGYTVIPNDIDEKIFDNFYIIKRKGKHFHFTAKKYGKPTP
jgi:broad specificity phosphatase PhoE